MWMTNLKHWSPNVPGTFKDPKEIEVNGTQAGGIVSEIGPPVANIPTWFGPVAGYILRKTRKNNRAFIHHGFGVFHTDEAFCAPRWMAINLPASGSRVVVNPQIDLTLSDILARYQGWTADVTWIIRNDVPLGASYQLRIFAPELNENATTRGVVWKPGTLPTLAFHVGWASPVPRFATAAASKIAGHPGGAIVIECVEDNSEESVTTPLKLHVWCWVHNITAYSAAYPDSWTEQANLSFVPVKAPTPPPPEAGELLFGEFQMADAAEVPVSGDAGALGDTAEAGVSNDFAAAAEQPGPPDTVRTAKKPPHKGEKKPVASKPQASAQNQKWYKWTTFSLTDANAAKMNSAKIIPATLPQRGDSPGIAFRRNVFHAGGMKNGICTGIEVKVVSHRPPTIASTIGLHTNGENHQRSYKFYHQLGGEETETPLMPDEYVDLAKLAVKQNLLVSPWIKASLAAYSLGIYYPFVNKTQAVKDPWITIYVRPGNSRFEVPVKPKKAAKFDIEQAVLFGKTKKTLTMEDLSNLGVLVGHHQMDTAGTSIMNSVLDLLGPSNNADMDPLSNALESLGLGFNELDGSVNDATDSQQQDDIAPTAITGPVGILQPYEGIAGNEGDPDKLSQDDMWVRVKDFDIPVDGSVKAITLQLWDLQDDAGFTGAVSPIQEKLERHMEIEPVSGGVYGPTIGHYQIKLRPPAGTTLDICHACLPPELNEEAAFRLFGIDSLLSLAGNALTSVGGSLLNGAINSVGNVLGAAVDSFLGATGGNSEAQEERAPGITGDIPISRYVEFIRTVKDSAGSVDYWPTLLVQALNLLGTPLGSDGKAVTTIPASLYVRMCNVLTRRNIYDRDVIFEPKQASLSLPVDREGFGIFMAFTARSGAPKAKSLAQRCLTVLAKRSFPYDLAKLESEELPSDEDVLEALRKVKTRVESPRNDDSLSVCRTNQGPLWALFEESPSDTQ